MGGSTDTDSNNTDSNTKRWRVIVRLGLLAAVAVSFTALSRLGRPPEVQSIVVAQSGVEPGIVVSVRTIGKPPDSGASSYRLNVRCTTGGQVTSAAQGITSTVTLELPPSGARRLGTIDFPSLTATDRCVVEANAVDGAQITYATAQPPRADGSQPEPMPGVVEGGRFQSASAPADGREVTTTITYVGDMIVSARIAGAPAGVSPSGAVTIRCANTGFLITTRILDNQTRLFSNVPAGSVCQVSTDQSGATFEDNSGDPRDGIVTVGLTPASCWDLRTADPNCRATVTITSTYSELTDLSSLQSTTVPPTTRVEEQPTNEPAAAVVAAPVEAPELLAEESAISFTG
jgi:hypothetical protein